MQLCQQRLINAEQTKCICLIVFNEITAQGAPLQFNQGTQFHKEVSHSCHLPLLILALQVEKEACFYETGNFTFLILSPAPSQLISQVKGGGLTEEE